MARSSSSMATLRGKTLERHNSGAAPRLSSHLLLTNRTAKHTGYRSSFTSPSIVWIASRRRNSSICSTSTSRLNQIVQMRKDPHSSSEDTRAPANKKRARRARGTKPIEPERGDFCTVGNFWSTASSSSWKGNRTVRNRYQPRKFPEPATTAANSARDRKGPSTVDVAHDMAASVKEIGREGQGPGFLRNWRRPERPQRKRRADTRPVLLQGYEQTIEALCSELSNTQAGDLVVFSVYMLEPGLSSTRLLEAMKAAAERGVCMDLSVDNSPSARFARMCEKTKSSTEELQALAHDRPGQVRFSSLSVPSHCKYLLCLRAQGCSSAIFGGINVGDRFASWEDFAVRIRDDSVVGCLLANLSLNGPVLSSWVRAMADCGLDDCEVDAADVADRMLWGERSASGGKGQPPGILFVTNKPERFTLGAWVLNSGFPGTFNLHACVDTFFSDYNFARYTVAMAYLDSSGAALISRGIERGAEITLVMPTTPNVYHDANLKALASLLERRHTMKGTLHAYLYPGMLHAKAVVGEGSGDSGEESGGRRRRQPDRVVSMIGSCNLKSRSFHQFSELNAVVVDPRFNRELRGALSSLVKRSRRVESASELKFSPIKANVEEWLG